jgi:hypothetical protein
MPRTNVLISGWLDGRTVDTLVLEIETMQYILGQQVAEPIESSLQTPRRSNFGVPYE